VPSPTTRMMIENLVLLFLSTKDNDIGLRNKTEGPACISINCPGSASRYLLFIKSKL
jgi:hypothetical protein